MTLVVSVSIHVQEQQEHQILQSDLNERERWPYTWSMQILSTHKSSHYHFLNNHILQQVDCSPYPGVTLTHDLRWTTRINITRKASSTLGILRRNLRFCPPSSRKTAYISLVHSVLEYSAVVWDPYQQNDIDKLENIQRCAARFINQNYKDRSPGHVTNMLRELGLQSLHQPKSL